MITRTIKNIGKTVGKYRFSQTSTPLVFSNGNAVFSVAQWWNGQPPIPSDYFVQHSLKAQIPSLWTQQSGVHRVIYQADINSPSMNINVNHLLKSPTLHQLIQLQATQKQRLVENPSTVIIKSLLKGEVDGQRILRNMLELDKLFVDAVGLKISYLINKNSVGSVQMMEGVKKRDKAISADVVQAGAKLHQLIFDQGYKLEHLFLDGIGQAQINTAQPFRYNFDLLEVMHSLAAINFRGKVILPGGNRFNPALQMLKISSREAGFTPKLQFSLGTDGWYTML